MTDHAPTPTHRTVTRRRVVQAGAHAAWVVPVVVATSAAPAAAAVSGPPQLSFTFTRLERFGLLLRVTAKIRNDGSTATDAPFSVVLDVTGTARVNNATSTTQTTATTPTFDAGVRSDIPGGGGKDVRFTYQSSGALQGGATTNLKVEIMLQQGFANANGMITDVTITALPGAGGTATPLSQTPDPS